MSWTGTLRRPDLFRPNGHTGVPRPRGERDVRVGDDARVGADAAVRVAPRPSSARRRQGSDRTLQRRACIVALWAVVVVFGAAYGASIGVPMWFALHQQRLLIVTSGSMAGQEPGAFDAGDAVVMRRISAVSQLKVGQVASFVPPGASRLVTHRIVALKNLPLLHPDVATGRMVPTLDRSGQVQQIPYLITKGDANAHADPDATPATLVQGVVLQVHPGWGAVLDWARSPDGRLALLGPPLLALATMELLSVLDARRRAAAHARTRRRHANERAIDALLVP